MMTDDEKVSSLQKMIMKEYRLWTKECGRYLTDSMRRALVSDALVSVMLVRYEAEGEKEQHTNPNLYVDAVKAVWKGLDL